MQLQKNFPGEVASGLVIEVLYYFTTPRGTSASHTEHELVNQFSYPEIVKIVKALKDKYLLTEPVSKTGKENPDTTRLAHDSLAPLIRELHGQSEYPAQRASRLTQMLSFVGMSS